MLNKMLIAIIPLLVLLSCSDDTCILDQTAPITADFSDIEDPRERWEAYGIQSYTLEQSVAIYGIDPNKTYQIVVKENELADVITVENCRSLGREEHFKSIDELFELIEHVNPDSVEVYDVRYHQKYGYPSMIYIDASFDIFHDEFICTNDRLEQLN